MSNDLKAKRYLLQKKEICFHRREPIFEVNRYENNFTNEMLLTISAYVMTNEQKFTTNIDWIRYPHTWWDHFLADAIPTFSKWFHLKPKYDTFDVKAHVNRLIIYPEIEPSTHEFQNYYVHDTINTNVVRSVK